jgi:predicted nucleic acid-binding protein
VLIAAARGTDEISRRALEILDDPDRTFASSAFVRLEVLPKALFHRKRAEAAFYEVFFEQVEEWVEAGPDLAEAAFSEAARNNLSALDALHVAAAASAGALELVTTEKRERPLHKVSAIRVRTLQD